jgi:hypothetical protein
MVPKFSTITIAMSTSDNTEDFNRVLYSAGLII